MGASNPSRFLDTGGSTARGNALTLYGGAVLRSFRLNTVFFEMLGSAIAHQVVSQGKSWEWPIIAEDPIPEYHIPGNELLGQTQNFNKVSVSIDDILVAHRDVPLDQRLISHYDPTPPYLDSMGKALAVDLDSKAANMIIQAARTAASTGYHYGGTRVGRTGSATVSTAYPTTPAGASAFRDDLAQMAQLMDEKHVPKEGRIAVITPYMLRVLTKDQGYVWGTPSQAAAGGPSTLFSNDYGMGNDVNRRVVTVCEGFNIVVSANIPDSNVTGTTYAKTVSLDSAGTTATSNRAALDSPTNPTKYAVNCSGTNAAFASGGGKPVALCIAPGNNGMAAVAMVEAAGGIQTDSFVDTRRNTLFLKSQNFFGMGVLCPWYAGEICVSSS